jgi:hypothetical protein
VCLRFAESDNQGFFHVGIDAVDAVLDVDAPTATPTPTASATPTRTPSATRTPSPTASPRPAALCADVDGNRIVTVRDILTIARQLLRKRFDARYDINRDGRVTVVDLKLAVRQLGKRCKA